MIPIYDNQTISEARDEKVIEAYKGKILFIGSRGKKICEELIDLNYSGLSLPTFSKAFYWLENQILSGAELPIAIISDYELSEGNVYSFYYKISSNRLLKLIPFIVIGDAKNREEKIKSLKIGIDDFYTGSVNAQDVSDRIQFLKEFKKLTAHLVPETEISLSHFFPLFSMPILKRLVDILISGISLIVLSPLFMLISFLILLDSKGPIFYISKRAGTGFKIFNFYKFRTMRVNADKELENVKHLNQYDSNGNASFFKINNDPRSTRLGKFLRSSCLDELPQLINVLKGDMSLVGNRPLPLYEAEKLTKDQWAKRFLAPAGITGLWQITKRFKGNMSSEERMELDITYAEKSSFVFDLKIIFLTFPALIHRES
jgi:lipopolysaccharide/colanic/teichoic acid biosynthesis glycosyltransferase